MVKDLTEEFDQAYFRKHYVNFDRRFQAVNERETPLQCMVQLCGAYNDLVLRKMHTQKDEPEIHLEWKVLFSRLFAEENMAVKLSRQSVRNQIPMYTAVSYLS